MFGIPFTVLAAYLMILFVGLEIDVGQSLSQFSIMQTGAEASTLAGAAQQHLVVNQHQSGSNAPVNYGYYLNQDGSPQQVATDTWNKNVSQWGKGPWQNTTPQFQLNRSAAKTPADQYDTVQATVSSTVDMSFSDKNLSTNAIVPLQNTVASTVHNNFQ